jgi:hypothetical protein
MSFKPYIKKPLVHSPRGEGVLSSVEKYLIRTPNGEAYTTDPRQALAALLAARKHGLRCLVYAAADVLGESAIELVDEEFLMDEMEKRK